MRRLITSVLAATVALGIATSANAAVDIVAASSIQGTLVHGTGPEQTGLTVTGALGAGGPEIVQFTGDTTQTAATSDLLRIQGGQGQADVTGAEITFGGSPNDTWDILSGNIFLKNGAGIDLIEFALTSGAVGTVDFIITANDGTYEFFNQVIGNGDTFFGFNTTGSTSITNVFYRADAPNPGTFSLLKQVRLDPSLAVAPPVPEPATWAMMLLGFGAIGVGMRRRKRSVLQAA